MDCNKCRQSLPILDELEDGAAEAVILHVNACPDCRRESEEYAFLAGILGSMGELDDIPFNWEQFAATTQETALRARARIVSAQPGAHRWIMRFAAASAFLFVSLALLFTALAEPDPGSGTGSRLTEIAALPESSSGNGGSGEARVKIDGPQAPIAAGPDALRPVAPEELAELGPGLNEGISLTPGAAGRPRTSVVPVWLGILSQTQRDGRLVITRIAANGPARHSGLQAGDVIVRCNNIDIRSSRALTQIITRLGPGRVVELTIKRENRFLRITAITARDPIL